MAKEYLTNETELKAVADAIRAKSGGDAPLSFPDGFAAAIAGISTGGGGASVTVAALEVTENGVYEAPAGSAYSPVAVHVAGAPTALIGTFELFDDWVGIVATVDMSALVGTFEVEEEET